MSSPLERRYRRWARVYPAGPRRQELVDTLVGCAPPDRQRPAAREVFNLLRHGLRARLGRPASRSIVVLATLVALVCGALTAAGTARLGWLAAPALPDGAQADALKQLVFPGQTAYGGGDAPLVVDTPDGESIEFGYADYWVKHTPATRDVDGFTAAARDRLVAAGWQMHGGVTTTESGPDAVTPERTAQFVAGRGGLVLAFQDTLWGTRAPWDSDGAASFTLSRAAPAWLWALTAAGGMLGALVGWLLAGWASRRAVPGGAAAAAVGVLAWPGVLLALLTVVWTGLVGMSTAPVTSQGVFLSLWQLSGLAWIVGAFAVLPVVLLAVRQGWSRRPRTLAAAVAVLLAAGVALTMHRPAPASSAGCHTAGPPPQRPAEQTRLSRTARVFVRQDTTPEQRNLIEAAIARVWGTRAFAFVYDPNAAEYRDAYCAGGRVPAGAAEALPYFWQVDLSSPGAVTGLDAEVAGMPGVLAVRRG